MILENDMYIYYESYLVANDPLEHYTILVIIKRLSVKSIICCLKQFIMIMLFIDLFLTVGLAKLLFPMEAKVAMDIAQVDGTSEFPLGIKSKNSSKAQRTTVDLNEAPFRIQEEHLLRMRALSKTGNGSSHTHTHMYYPPPIIISFVLF